MEFMEHGMKWMCANPQRGAPTEIEDRQSQWRCASMGAGWVREPE